MRAWPWLLILALAACGNSGMTRNFGVSRDAAPETMASTRVPLSTPPELAARPSRPIAIGGGASNAQPNTDQTPASAGETALVQAAGPASDPHVRTEINEKSGMVYPTPEFTDRLMNWTPPAGYTPIITQGSNGGWFSRIF